MDGQYRPRCQVRHHRSATGFQLELSYCVLVQASIKLSSDFACSAEHLNLDGNSLDVGTGSTHVGLLSCTHQQPGFAHARQLTEAQL